VKTYADTSFLFSLYASDANSIKADAWRQANPTPLPFTAFHRLELRNALKMWVHFLSGGGTGAHWFGLIW